MAALIIALAAIVAVWVAGAAVYATVTARARRRRVAAARGAWQRWERAHSGSLR